MGIFVPIQVGRTSISSISNILYVHICTISSESYHKSILKTKHPNQTHFIESSSRSNHPSLSKIQISITFHLVVVFEPNQVGCASIWNFYYDIWYRLYTKIRSSYWKRRRKNRTFFLSNLPAALIQAFLNDKGA